MDQDSLDNLARFSTVSDIAKQIDLATVISNFDKKKERKAILH